MTAVELSCGLPPGPQLADLAVLAAVRTTRVGLGTAVLVPSQRSVMTMASGIATIARLSGGRLRACFGTGFTARLAVGERPITLDALFDYVSALGTLGHGETALMGGRPARMLHAPRMADPRPIDVPLWLSVLGPKGSARAADVADGIIGHRARSR